MAYDLTFCWLENSKIKKNWNICFHILSLSGDPGYTTDTTGLRKEEKGQQKQNEQIQGAEKWRQVTIHY